MAAIFQIRRGNSSYTSSLMSGELYLDQTSQNLIVGVTDSTKQITLVKLNDINTGSLNLTGDIRLSGSIYLGDGVATDNISALGVFTTNLVPNGTIDLGTTSAKWNNVYGNSIWGAISASNGVLSGSAQFIGVLSSLNDFTSSQVTKNSTLQTYTASIDSKILRIQESTASINLTTASLNGHVTDINTWSASVKGHITDINTKTGSFETKFSNIQASTASLNTFTASVNGHISDINTKTGSFETKWTTLQNVTSSILSYTSSLKTAIELTGSSVTILGNLVVKGTNTFIDSTTIQLGDNILELNGTATSNGGLLVKDTTGTSGSLLWDSTNDYWKGGTIGNEEKLLRAGSDGVISGSLSSLNTFTASVNGHIADINTKTGSFETKFSTLGTYTASLDTKNTTLQTYTASIDSKILRIQESTASINLTTASLNGHVTDINTWSASVKGHIVDINAWTASQATKDSTLQLYTASLDTKNNTLQAYTASIDTKFSTLQTLTASVQSQISRIQESTASLNIFSSSINAFYNNFTASTNGFSASVDFRLDQLEYTASYGNAANTAAQFAAIGITTGSLNSVTASLMIATASLQTFSASVLGHISDINVWTASVKGHITDINIKTGSFENKFTTLQTLTGSFETTGRGIISGSSQITTLLPQGVVSGSAQVSGSIFSTITGDVVIASNGVATIQANSVTLGVDTTGNYMSDLTQGTGVTISHTPGEGSNATISIAQAVATTSNVQFGSLGVGTAASGVSGEIRATGDITAYYSSDERLKENILPISNALNKVNEISGNTYDWKEGFEEIHSHTGNDIGVIAQEIEKVLPQAVIDRESGYKAVNYEKIVPLLIEAIKELSAKVKELENK